MKKIILCAAMLVAGTALFAEKMTRSSVSACIEKFLNGNGKYVKIISQDDGTAYLFRDYIWSAAAAENGNIMFYTADRDEVSFGPSGSTELTVNDISLDANNNIVLTNK